MRNYDAEIRQHNFINPKSADKIIYRNVVLLEKTALQLHSIIIIEVLIRVLFIFTYKATRRTR